PGRDRAADRKKLLAQAPDIHEDDNERKGAAATGMCRIGVHHAVWRRNINGLGNHGWQTFASSIDCDVSRLDDRRPFGAIVDDALSQAFGRASQDAIADLAELVPDFRLV